MGARPRRMPARKSDRDETPDEAQSDADEVDEANEQAVLAEAGTAEGEAPAAPEVDDEPRAEVLPAPVRDPVQRFLSEAEERALGVAVRERGDMDAARTLVVHNLRLVISIAYQYRRAWANILDLFQEGSVGLMEAVKRWEPTLGPRFGTYAAYWIRAYVLRFLMTNSRLIHVGNTRAGRKLFFRLEKERQKLLAAGIEVTPKLLAANLDVDEKELDEVRQHLASREVSLDPRGAGAGDGGEDSYPLSERVPAGDQTPETEAAQAELSEAVQRLVADFQERLTDERERAVWREHLAADEPRSLGELGTRFGVTKQRMGQIADQLKKRFRAEIIEKLGPEIRTDWLGAQD
jgi:RNA polymerase sigma-32 factor